MTFKILSLDGGGMRGVLSARILKEIEGILAAQTGQKLHEYFDLIAGTSTGSILAGGIACQITANKLIDFYKEEGENIFLKSVRRQRGWRWLSRLTGNRALYPNKPGEKGLAKVLMKRLIAPELGRCPAIGEINHPNLLILAYDVLSRNTTWFTNNHGDNNRTWYDNIGLWAICCASASAPTYFPPYDLPFNADQYLPHIDGGVSANSPELAAIAHALLLNKDRPEFSLSDIAVFSIGTGKTTLPYTSAQVKKWGLLDWIRNLPHIFMDPSAEISVAISRQILESINAQRYLRLNFDLNERLKGERIPGRLREVGEPYNQYLEEETGKKIALSEEIDNPEICDDLILAAECYLDRGQVAYNAETMPIRSAIQQFIEAN